jgi:proline dehydrogenase
MGLARSLLLAGSQSAWLRERAHRWSFVRRSVSRFMPGETAADALAAAARIRSDGIGTILTCLGENVSSAGEADGVADHYVDVIERVAAAGLDAQISVKPTQLGLDLSTDGCADRLRRLAAAARDRGSVVWIDMESSAYVDRTLDVYRRVRSVAANVGVCLQAYLHRTPADLEALRPLAPVIRLVKGAYREPPDVALPHKRDVDARYFELAATLLRATAERPGTFAGIATHDMALIERVLSHGAARSAPEGSWEIEMLYGIRRSDQRRLAASGRRVRVLVSYGASWFPWYMRRLAERPANVWFVARNLFAR